MPDIDITTLRLDQPGVRAALGDLEAEIMEIVWRRGPGQPVTVREVWEELYPRRSVMYTTVMNTMTRLGRKGLLETERDRQAFAYRARLTREAFVDHFVGEALEHLLVNFGGATQAQLGQVAGPEQQERLTRLLEEIRRRSSTSPNV